MAEIPEEILRRSAEAKAKASGRPVEEILAEMKGEAAAAVEPAATAPSTPDAAAPAAAAPAAAAPAAAAPAAAADDSLKSKAQAAAAALPEHLLRRSAEAKAAALGISVEEVIAEMTGRTEAPATEATEATVAPAVASTPAATGEIDWKAAGEKAGMPEKLLRRSVEAKVKAGDKTEEQILTEMVGDIPRISDEEPTAPAAATPPVAAAAPAPAPATAPTGEVDWDAAATAAGMPAKLFRRSAEAKASATGRPIGEIVAEMTGGTVAETTGVEAAVPAPEAAPPAAAPSAEAAPPAAAATSTGEVDWDAAATAAGMPAKLFQRSAEAKAKATGRPIGEIVAELSGVEPTAAAPAEAPAPAATPAPAAAPAAAPAVGGAVDWAAAAGAAGIPESLFRRSAEARAKASARPVGEVVAEMTGVETAAPAAATAPAAAAPAAPAAAAVATAPAPAALPPVPDGVNTQRLLTVVQANAIQGAKREPVDKVNVWPHLLAIEFVALLVVLALLIIFSVFQDAPLLELANPNAQPNPSKAPWYFLGLQELLSYFDPEVAGVLIPGLGLAGLAIIPYIDRNPSTRPSDRKFAIMVFTFFVVAAAILTIIGSFYRGRGFNFTFPWRDGIFFDL